MTVRCGHKTHDLAIAPIHHHETVDMVRKCYSLEHGLYSLEESHYVDVQDAAFDPDQAYERYLEGGGAQAEIIAEENRRDLAEYEDFMDAMAAVAEDRAEQAGFQREHEGRYNY